MQYSGRQQRYNSNEQDMTPVSPTPSIFFLTLPFCLHPPLVLLLRITLHLLFLRTILPLLGQGVHLGVLPAPSMFPPPFPTGGDHHSRRPLVCPSLVHKQAGKCLPSTALVKQKLLVPAEVLAKYPKLLVKNKAPTLGMELAR